MDKTLNRALLLALLITMNLWFFITNDQLKTQDASSAQVELTDLNKLTADFTTSPIRYHRIDNNLVTFTPMPNVVCYWLHEQHADTASFTGFPSADQPKIINRVAGQSCVQLAAPDYDTYLDKYPKK
jgi:hypothetical protein